MSDTDTCSVSRRQFLAGCGAVGATAASASVAHAATGQIVPPSPSIRSQTFSNEGEISPYGQAKIADFDRRFEQQRGSPGEVIHVVKDWGLDPTGSEPINDTFEEKISGISNTRVVFPGDGVFAVPSDLTFSPAGPIDIIGNGATLKIPPDTQCKAIEGVGLPAGTRIEGFVIDMTAEGTWAETFAETDGIAELRNIEMKGYCAPIPREQIEMDAILTPIARSESSKIRVRNFIAIGGTAADMHSDRDDMPPSAPENQKGTPIGLWVGQATSGTVQMLGCKLRGWQNGTYSGRTHGTVQILGGAYWNNSNCQVRIGGGSVVDGATLLLDDREWDMKQNPGPYSLGAHQGVLAARIDPGGNRGNQKDPARFINVDVQGLSMQTLPALLNWEGSAGPGLVSNTKITNHLDVPAILGAPPGSQFSYDAAPQTNIMVENSLITGPTTEVAEVHDRPQSRIRTTCIKVPGASEEGINGMQIGPAVSFGKKCKDKAGLLAPKKVGSPGNISSLPAPSYNGSTGTFSRSTPSKKAVGAGAGGLFAAIFGGIIGGLGMIVMMIFLVPLLSILALLWGILGD